MHRTRREKMIEQNIVFIENKAGSLQKVTELLAEAGIDIIELGIPFSDPTADGPVIQDASYRSICKGTNLKGVFAAVEEVRKDCDVPLVFMMYYNTILYYGVDAFARKCAEVGVDGLIIPDLPKEEQFELVEALDNTENAPILIQLVAPVSADRIPMILENARGYVYLSLIHISEPTRRS